MRAVWRGSPSNCGREGQTVVGGRDKRLVRKYCNLPILADYPTLSPLSPPFSFPPGVLRPLQGPPPGGRGVRRAVLGAVPLAGGPERGAGRGEDPADPLQEQVRGGGGDELARGEGRVAGPRGRSGGGTLCQSSDVQEGVPSCCKWQGGAVTAVKVYITAVHVYINAAHVYISLRLPSLCTMRRPPLS